MMGQVSSILRDASDGSLMFWCPGCKHVHGVRVGTQVEYEGRMVPPLPAEGRPCWGWNNNLEKPTFTPSLLITSEPWYPPVTHENLEQWKANPWPQERRAQVCHSFITDGRIQFLNDCTHELANQTVDIPPWPER